MELSTSQLRVGDRVTSTTGIYLGKVTQILSTVFYTVDQSGAESGYATRPEMTVIVDRATE